MNLKIRKILGKLSQLVNIKLNNLKYSYCGRCGIT